MCGSTTQPCRWSVRGRCWWISSRPQACGKYFSADRGHELWTSVAKESVRATPSRDVVVTNLAAQSCVVFSSADKAYPSACLLNRSSKVINSHRPSRRHTSSGSMSLFLSSSAGASSRLAFARRSLVTRRAVESRLYASHQSIGFFSHSRLPKAIAAALSNPSSFSWLWNLTLSHLFPQFLGY